MINCLKRFTVLAGFLFSVALALAEVGDEHLAMGNPSGATADLPNQNNYLMRKQEYVLSYNNSTGCPNWVCWHLNSSWMGSADRQNDFRPDPDIPNGWLQVRPKDYANSGFDKGHMCNSKDRSRDKQANSATFFMSNMVPQSPKNNEHTWEQLEEYCRKLASKGNELYIICGPFGCGGEGSHGKKNIIEAAREHGAKAEITVPAKTWKVVLILPSGKTSAKDVTKEAVAIAVIMPNDQKISLDWKQYIVSVGDVEALTHLKFFTEVDPTVAVCIKKTAYHPSAAGGHN